MPGLVDHLVVAILLLAMPFHGLREFRRLTVSLADTPEARLDAYRRIIGWQWSAALVLLVLWQVLGRPLSALGIRLPQDDGFLLAAAVAAAVVILLAIQNGTVKRRPAAAAKVRAAAEPLREMLPSTPRELERFSWLGVTAGIVEELLFRGYVFWYFGTMTGPWVAIFLTSVVFGLGHAYQGVAGVVKTGAVGLLFGWLAWISGSLWVPMFLHAMADVLQGRMVYFALSSGPEGSRPVVS